jgi:hypothetical protein
VSYQSIVEMAGSPSLQTRIVASAAEEGIPDALAFVQANIWTIVARGNWDAAWDSARANPSPNVNPDTGMRDDVVTDGMILAVIQPMVPPPPEPEPEPEPVQLPMPGRAVLRRLRDDLQEPL